MNVLFQHCRYGFFCNELTSIQLNGVIPFTV